MFTKGFGGRVDDAVVAPPHHAGHDASREPHRRLHHLEGPRGGDLRIGSLALQPQMCIAHEIAGDDRVVDATAEALGKHLTHLTGDPVI